MENKGKLWYNHDVNIGAAAVGEKARLEQSDIKQWRSQAHSLAVIELRLSEWRLQSDSQSVENFIAKV